MLLSEPKGPKHTHLAIFWNFCIEWRHDVNMKQCNISCHEILSHTFLRQENW